MGLDWQNVIDNRGLAIAVSGMLIVFTALALISLYVALLPRILRVINRWFPEPAAPASVSVASGAVIPATGTRDPHRAAAAAVAFHHHHGGPS